MTEIVNLNKARKAKLKQDKAATAAQNRVVHGLTKAQRQTQALQNKRTQVHLEQKRLDAGNSDKND